MNTRSAYTRKKSLTNALPFVKYYCTCLLQDIIVLKVVCARINRPFILPARLHCPQCYSTIARLWGNIRPPLDLPFVCHTPYNIGNNNIVLRPTNATPAHTAPLLMVVSRCRGIGPPSGIPSSGLCFCWLPIFVVVQLQTSWEYPSPLYCLIYVCVCVRACACAYMYIYRYVYYLSVEGGETFVEKNKLYE